VDFSLRVWSPDTHQRLAVIRFPNAVNDSAFNHAGDLLAAVCWDHNVAEQQQQKKRKRNKKLTAKT
jgi:hypothetical protein